VNFYGVEISMGMIEEGGQTVRSTVEALKGFPALIMLLAVNVMFLALVGAMVYAAVDARMQIMTLLHACIAQQYMQSGPPPVQDK
jgi:hypothetical protein